jgi:hypothetical protein
MDSDRLLTAEIGRLRQNNAELVRAFDRSPYSVCDGDASVCGCLACAIRPHVERARRNGGAT